jgi:hypothetical protein
MRDRGTGPMRVSPHRLIGLLLVSLAETLTTLAAISGVVGLLIALWDWGELLSDSLVVVCVFATLGCFLTAMLLLPWQVLQLFSRHVGRRIMSPPAATLGAFVGAISAMVAPRVLEMTLFDVGLTWSVWLLLFSAVGALCGALFVREPQNNQMQLTAPAQATGRRR